MKTLKLLAALFVFAQQVSAGDQPIFCEGDTSWRLEVADELATLSFPSPTELEVMLTTTAEGRDWPVAYTLIGQRDTAVLILDRRQCGDKPLTAELLTQRAQTPIFLTGCCEYAE